MDKLLLMVFLFGPALLGAQENTSELVGTWELESVEELDASGAWITSDRLGIDPTGFIHYDVTGNMMVQIMGQYRSLLPEFDKDAPYDRRRGIEAATKDQLSEIVRDYVAYFGTYEVNLEDQFVIHYRDGHLVPNVIGDDAKRFYTLEGDKLTLSPPGEVARRVWRRIM